MTAQRRSRRQLIVWMSLSIDGFMSGPNGELDWQLIDAELHDHFNDELSQMGAFLDGRVTYELMAEYWPTADQDPDSSASEVEFARIWRDMPKIVYSRTLEQAGWNTTIKRTVDASELRALQEEPGGDLVLGGADLANTFLDLDLVDQLHLYIHPVLIGQGKRLFREGTPPLHFEQARTHTFGNGVVLLRYARAG